MSTKNAMPELTDVLEYAKPLLKKFIGEKASEFPFEHRQEMEQEGYLRIIRIVYPNLKPDEGWRSYVYQHCEGAVDDYLKLGKGFQETRKTIAKVEDQNSRFRTKIRERVDLTDRDGNEIELDSLLGKSGIFEEMADTEIEINWDLLARMASQDKALHAFAKFLRNITIDKMSSTFDVRRARAGQLIQDFIDRFDDPKCALDPWFHQTCFALGLCDRLGIPNIDRKIGWSLEPVDLDRIDERQEDPQLGLLVLLGDHA